MIKHQCVCKKILYNTICTATINSTIGTNLKLLCSRNYIKSASLEILFHLWESFF